MKRITICFSDEKFEELKKAADNKKVSVQEYIHGVLFDDDDSIYTVQEAERRALARFKKGDEFSLPDLYTVQEWQTLALPQAGVFGRKFFTYTQNNPAPFEFTQMYKRIARYRMK